MENLFIISTGILFISWIVYEERKFRKVQRYTYLYLKHKESIDRGTKAMSGMGCTVSQVSNAIKELGKAMRSLPKEL